MKAQATRAVGPSTERILDAVADPTRRAAAAELRQLSDPVPTGTLASAVGGTDADGADQATESSESIHVTLVHRHLPKLDAAGLVEWDADAGTVELTDHPVHDDSRYQGLLDADADDWDGVLDALAPTRRRIALAVLQDAGSLDRVVLARRVLAVERDVDPGAVVEDDVESLLVRFHHVDLPVLEDAGLVTRDDETVSYVGRPDLKPGVFTFGLDADGPLQPGEAGVDMEAVAVDPNE